MSFVDRLPDDSISILDRALAERLGQLLNETSPQVLALVAMASAAVRAGHVALDLQTIPKDLASPSLTESPVVGQPGEFKPLILEDERLYLHRYHRHEVQLAHDLQTRAQIALDVDRSTLDLALDTYFPSSSGSGTDDQRRAARIAATRALCVVTGGPGTGKTTLVVRMLATLAQLEDAPLRVRLLAPTGKAAHRLGATVAAELDALNLSDSRRQTLPTTAETIHRALGSIRGSRVRFRHNATTPLPADIVIVDEASMVDLALMRRLVEAVPATARLVLLGDPNQLASVDAGSVLASLCRCPAGGDPNAPIAGSLAHLTHSWRFAAKGGIGALAQAIQSGDGAAAKQALTDSPELTWIRAQPTTCDILRDHTVTGFTPALTTGDSAAALSALGEFKILCAIRKGPRGVDSLNHWCEQTLDRSGHLQPGPGHYEGRPILIQRNDYAIGLFNGDQGLVRRTSQGLVACFETAVGLQEVSTVRLPDHATAFAMSIHKSQGSEYNKVAIVLPEDDRPMLSRELLYTAITRAREEILLYASPEALTRAIETPTERVSGLAQRLWRHP